MSVKEYFLLYFCHNKWDEIDKNDTKFTNFGAEI
jgi:hypothetical protein